MVPSGPPSTPVLRVPTTPAHSWSLCRSAHSVTQEPIVLLQAWATTLVGQVCVCVCVCVSVCECVCVCVCVCVCR